MTLRIVYMCQNREIRRFRPIHKTQKVKWCD